MNKSILLPINKIFELVNGEFIHLQKQRVAFFYIS